MPLVYGSVAKSDNLYQYDYGQRLLLTGVELPFAYEVHFSNSDRGESKTSIGDSTGVDIPDEFLLSGSPIHVWLFLHDTVSDGETEYHGIIGVIKRSKPTDIEPTPVQQDAITQAIAALDAAVEQTGEDLEATTAAKEAAEDAQEAAEAARDRAVEAEEATAEAQATVEGYIDDAQGYAEACGRNAELAAGYAEQCAADAEAADESAKRAEQAATAAGFMEVYIDERGHLIYLRTDQVDADFSLDDGHLILQSA